MKKPRTKKSQGLGDTIEAGLQAVGIDKVAKWILGEDCGCQERKEKLNALFPYKKPNCLTENHYKYLTLLFERETLKPSDKQAILLIYNRTFNTNNGGCQTCWDSMINELKKVYESYTIND